jgi:hypothetical protein
MGIKSYLAISVIAFLAATTGSDVFAAMTIGGQRLGPALAEHLYWARVEFVGTLLLLAPFGLLAVIGSWVEGKAGRWKALIVFSVATICLVYSYFEGYEASKVAELDKHWTAATVDVGFLPFTAVPVVLLAWLIGYVAVRTQRKVRDLVEKD